MFVFRFLAASLFILIVNATKAKIPEYIHVCKRNDPHVTKCVRDSIEALRPKLKIGIPELNVPGLEPLIINEIVIFQGEGTSHFKALLKNVNVNGASDFQITKLKINIERSIYRVGVKIPALQLNGDYDINARLLVVPITGQGRFVANVTDCEGQGVLRAEVFERDGYKQIKFNSFDFAIRIGDYNMHLDNLFNGDPVLGQAANEVLHQSKQEFINAAIPFIQRKTAEILLEIANQITKNLDYDEVFPIS